MNDVSALLPSLRLLARAAGAVPFGGSGFVAAGGVAPFLYRMREGAREPHAPVLGTLDSDIVTPRRSGRPWPPPPIPERLSAAGMTRVEAPGFRSERGAEYYQDAAFGALRLAPEYIEFLTWKRGKDPAFADLASGVRAQTLRYLDLLTFEPLTFDLSRIEALALRKPTEVLIPQPAMFIIQKVLCRPERPPQSNPRTSRTSTTWR